MAKIKKVSYPTLRNQLNVLIETITDLEDKNMDRKNKILELLEAGEISAKEAAKRLREV